MKKVNAAYEKNAHSILALRDLLQMIIRQPAAFAENVEILKALKSQGATAALEIEFDDDGEARRKHRMSINTLKAHAANVFERGFEGFDAMRIGALDAVNTFKTRRESSNKRTKAGLSKRTEELEAQLERHQMTNMVLLQGIAMAVGELRAMKKGMKPALVEKRAKDAVETLLSLLGINPPPFNTLTDRSLSDAHTDGSQAEEHSVRKSMAVNEKVTDMDDYRK